MESFKYKYFLLIAVVCLLAACERSTLHETMRTISDFPWGRSAFEHYFALLRHDRNLDDTADGFPSNYGRGDMSNLRLHAGDASHGCVTVPYAPDSSEWSQIQEMLEKTRRGAPITIQKQTYPNFGTLKIIGEGYGSLPK